MRMRRLGWAGIELEAGGERIVIDAIADAGPIFSHFLGPEAEPLVRPDAGSASAALLTHLHRDHADAAAVDDAAADGAPVLRPASVLRTEWDRWVTGDIERELLETGRPQVACAPWEARAVGPFRVTALPAVDGLGSPQVSWLVEADGARVLHAGDTLWHGSWWAIAQAAGPIDAACLPANGAQVAYPHLQPAVDGVPAVMTPEQAIQAGRALGAATVVPIHDVRMFEHDEYYRPEPDARRRLTAAGAQSGVDVRLIDPGVWIEV